MNLTFTGFLKGYCQELTGKSTLNFKKLIYSASTDAPRVAEPLFLLALLKDKGTYVLNLAQGTWMEGSYCDVLDLYQKHGSLESFLNDENLPQRYKNVWSSFLAIKNKAVTDRRVIGLMRTKTLEALHKRSVTCYRLCKDLSLNRGNVYAYLHGGDTAKVSRDTARKIMDYALAASAS